MYSVVTYAGNSVLNYNLDYKSLLYLGYCEQGLLLQNFFVQRPVGYTVILRVWHIGSSRWFVLADLARPVILQAKFRIYTSAFLNEINNKKPCLFNY